MKKYVKNRKTKRNSKFKKNKRKLTLRQKGGNPKNKTAILMYCTPDLIEKWARHYIFLNKKYAEKNGYDFILITSSYCLSSDNDIDKLISLAYK